MNLKAVFLSFSLTAAALAGQVLEVHKSKYCGCCESWIKYMKNAGYDVRIINAEEVGEDLDKFKLSHGISADTASCHTGLINGYAIEGHVPEAEVAKLLKQSPADVLAIAAPGMPIGSPGMEQGGEKDVYDVVLVKKDGSVEVIATYRGQEKLR